MLTGYFRLADRSAGLLSFICVWVLAMVLAACGGEGAGATTPKTTPPSSSSPIATTSAPGVSTPSLTVVTIKATKDPTGKTIYTTDPSSVSLKKGETINVVNQGDEDLDFDGGDASQAGVDFIVPGGHNALVMFEIPGSFTISSPQGAKLVVTVSETATSTPLPIAATATIKEPTEKNYVVEPASLTVKQGDVVKIINQSDDDQDFDEGDASTANVDFIVAGNHNALVAFNTVGTFAIKSKVGAQINITVSN